MSMRRRDFRLIPILLVAIACLAVLKVAGIALDGGYILMDEPQPKKLSWAQETLNFPVPGGKIEPPDITGSVDAKKEETPKNVTETSVNTVAEKVYSRWGLLPIPMPSSRGRVRG